MTRLDRTVYVRPDGELVTFEVGTVAVNELGFVSVLQEDGTWFVATMNAATDDDPVELAREARDYVAARQHQTQTGDEGPPAPGDPDDTSGGK